MVRDFIRIGSLSLKSWDNVAITDEGLSHLQKLPHLTKLKLEACEKITDRGLQSLQSLDLRSFSLWGCTQITDAGLLHLKEMKNLKKLELTDCKITNEGLKCLSSLPLQTITVDASAISKEQLQKDIPSLENIYLRPEGL